MTSKLQTKSYRGYSSNSGSLIQINNLEETEDQTIEHGPQAAPGPLDETTFLHVLVNEEGEPAHIPVSTNLGLKYKRLML